MSPHQLIAITGSSGVGKSTLARALQERLLPDQWMHFSVDSIFYCLPASVIWKLDHENDRSAVDSKATVAAAYACAKTLLNLGHKVVFDAVIMSEKGARAMEGAFEGFDPLFVYLTCSREEIKRRTLARGDRTLEEAEHGFRTAENRLAAHHTFDTTTASPEEIATRIAKVLHDRHG